MMELELDAQRRSSSSSSSSSSSVLLMNGGGGGGEHERTSSMENEPRTLNYSQIHFAREAALFVVKTTSLEEAISIFTQGMERVEEGRWSSASGGEADDIHKRRSETEEEDEEELNGGGRSSSSVKIRDIATAPF